MRLSLVVYKCNLSDYTMYMETIEIPLFGKHGLGKVAIIDEDDLHKVIGYKWQVYNGYATRSDYTSGKRKNIKMHHLVLPKKDGLINDHINGNRLDNRKCNLRYATLSENAFNRVNKKNYFTHNGYWFVQISGKRFGRYHTEEEAIKYRDIYTKDPSLYKALYRR